jgi:hypothetical protein
VLTFTLQKGKRMNDRDRVQSIDENKKKVYKSPPPPPQAEDIRKIKYKQNKRN